MDSHFNSYKVRYDTLNKYMLPICNSQIIRSLNVFIDLDDLFHTLHSPLINNEFQICGKDAPIQLVSNIFNLIAHYRYWAIKHQYDVKVFAIYTSSLRKFKNNIYNKDYRKHFKNINSIEYASSYFVNNALESAYPILHVISGFIPDIYIIDSKYLEPSMIPLYIANDYHEADWNILVSRDIYNLQYSYRNKWSLVTPKGDNSRVVNQYGIWNYINFKEKVYKDNLTKDIQYPYELFIIGNAVVGNKYRSIPRLRKVGWKTLFTYLDEVMEENVDKNMSTLKLSLIEKVKGRSKLSNEEINANLNCIDIDMQYDSMLELDKAVITSQLRDVPDYNGLQEMNRTRFMKYPLNLQFLCNRQEDIKRTPFDIFSRRV